jgi:nucleoside phosphorylase
VSVTGDPNHYHVGPLPSSDPDRPHRVVVTILPQDGTRNASAVSSDLVRSFPSVRCVVMCGIAGGIPAPHDPKKHVRLGDIVVVTEGVVDYDHVRTVDGEDSLRRPVEGMSRDLLRGVRELQVMEYADRRPWQRWLDTGPSSTLAAFARPDDSTDVLVIDGVVVGHPNDEGFRRRPGVPRVHYAAIGSAVPQ